MPFIVALKNIIFRNKFDETYVRPLLKNYKKFQSKLKINGLKMKSNHVIISIKVEKVI